MLADEGYDVVGQAGDGAKAIELAEELRPDLVILDVKMPVLDGIAAAEAIAGQRIAPVVMLTAFSQRDLVERARDAGAMSYLVKPFTQTELVPAIEMAVSRFAEITELEAQVTDLEDRLETRKAVERAKSILQDPAVADRAGGVPVDPEDSDGPPDVHAGSRRGCRLARSARQRLRRLRPAASRWSQVDNEAQMDWPRATQSTRLCRSAVRRTASNRPHEPEGLMYRSEECGATRRRRTSSRAGFSACGDDGGDDDDNEGRLGHRGDSHGRSRRATGP